MKRYLILFLILSPLAIAKDRNWQDSIFLGGQTDQAGAMAMPIGTMIFAAPLHRQYFWFSTPGLNYELFFPSRLSGRIPSLTVNGHTKIAVEGRHMHVLDDDGKDWKLNLVMKVAPPLPK